MIYTCFYCKQSFNKNRCPERARYFCSRECHNNQQKLEQSDEYTIIRHAFKKSEHRALRSRLEFSITLEYAYVVWKWQNGICALSGLSIHYADTKSAKRSGTNTASLDRIDSSLGYILGNVQFIHKDIQTMKWNMHEDKFIYMCRCISEHTKDRLVSWSPKNPDKPLDMTDIPGTIAAEAMNAPLFDAEYFSQAF